MLSQVDEWLQKKKIEIICGDEGVTRALCERWDGKMKEEFVARDFFYAYPIRARNECLNV